MSSLGASGQDLLSWAFSQTATGSFYIDGSFTTENNPFPDWWGTGILLRPAVDTAAVVVVEPFSGRIAVNRTDAGHWVGWQYLTTATQSQEYSLSLTDGFTQITSCTYHRNQFSEVFVGGSASGLMEDGTVIAILPEGFRPKQTGERPATFSVSGAQAAGSVTIKPDGNISVHGQISAAGVVFALVFVAVD